MSRCPPPIQNHGAAEGEGREGCSTALSLEPVSKRQKPFPKAHTHEWWFTTAAHGAVEAEEKQSAEPQDLYFGCIACILMGASWLPSARGQQAVCCYFCLDFCIYTQLSHFSTLGVPNPSLPWAPFHIPSVTCTEQQWGNTVGLLRDWDAMEEALLHGLLLQNAQTPSVGTAW